jgi:hypothetical protein
MPSPAKSVLPPTWTQVLAAMQQALAQALAASPEPAAPAARPPDEPPWQAALERLDHHLGQLDAGSRRATQGAADLDAELADGADLLRQWLAAATANRQALAEGADRKV